MVGKHHAGHSSPFSSFIAALAAWLFLEPAAVMAQVPNSPAMGTAAPAPRPVPPAAGPAMPAVGPSAPSSASAAPSPNPAMPPASMPCSPPCVIGQTCTAQGCVPASPQTMGSPYSANGATYPTQSQGFGSPTQGPPGFNPTVPTAAQLPSPSYGVPRPPADTLRFALGLNVAQPAAYYIGSSFFEHSRLVPVPIEFHGRLSRDLGIGGTLLYRYHRDGTVLRIQEIAAAAGPRISLTGNGLEGPFLSAKIGLGFAGGKDYSGESYSRFDLVLQPEIGYALWWDSSHLYLVVGAGLQSLVPLLESPRSIPWNSLGKVFQYYQPLLNLTLGLST
jgi:hypothetical protein